MTLSPGGTFAVRRDKLTYWIPSWVGAPGNQYGSVLYGAWRWRITYAYRADRQGD